MKLSERIRQLRIQKGITQEELGAVIGVQKSAIRKYESGMVENMKRSSIQKLSVFFGVSPSYLLGYDEEERICNFVRIPVLGRVAAGTPLYADEDIEDYVEIPYTLAKTGEFTGLRIHGHSMEPEIKDNDIVVVKLQEEAENGDIVIAFVGNEEATCKRFRATDSGIMLVPINTAFDPLAFTRSQMREMPVKIYGKVVSCMRYY